MNSINGLVMKKSTGTNGNHVTELSKSIKLSRALGCLSLSICTLVDYSQYLIFFEHKMMKAMKVIILVMYVVLQCILIPAKFLFLLQKPWRNASFPHIRYVG